MNLQTISSRAISSQTISSQTISNQSIAGKIARLPLSLIPREAVVPILRGRLRGRRWIVGSAIHRCWLGFYEFKKQALISSMVRPGTIFYDVGANVGFYSLLAAALVGPEGQVFAFEPLPRNLAYLRKHLELNRVSNVEILELAIAEQNGIASFIREPSGFMGRLSDTGGLPVAVATLDSLLEKGRLVPPHSIKMDIEGAELLALRGAATCIQQYRPLIFLATHGRDVHTACCNLLKSWDYECTEFGAATADGLGEIVARPSRSR
ncbi:MAG: FkbM family methyltransferase [Candidatus Sulfotelmatobacter sp.]